MSPTGSLRRPIGILGPNVWVCIRMGYRTLRKDPTEMIPQVSPERTPSNPSLQLKNIPFFLSVPSLALFCWNKPWFRSQRRFWGRAAMTPPTQHSFLQTQARRVLLTCRVWLKRFNGVAFTGGMRFASDVTLERGLTRLLLGSYRVKKQKQKQKKGRKMSRLITDNKTLTSPTPWATPTELWDITSAPS